MPDMGSQVICLVDWDGEDGAVMGAIWSDKDTTPTGDGDAIHMKLASGTEIVVNKMTGDVAVKTGEDGVGQGD